MQFIIFLFAIIVFVFFSYFIVNDTVNKMSLKPAVPNKIECGYLMAFVLVVCAFDFYINDIAFWCLAWILIYILIINRRKK
jgi:hypothetical protein